MNEITVGEIVGAYCPGAFDMAIAGRKFCGIAQRRQTGAFIIQAFIVIEGVGAERARAVAEFYRNAGSADDTYPTIIEQSTASLQELLPSVSVPQFAQKLKEILLRDWSEEQQPQNYYDDKKLALEQLVTQMKTRYDVD